LKIHKVVHTISNLFIYLQVTSLHPKFYKPIFFGDVKSSPNYTERLILTGIATTTLYTLQIFHFRDPPVNLMAPSHQQV
jgi:hypothetical protein